MLFRSWPDHIKPGTTSDALVDQIDLLASLTSLTNQQLSHNEAPDSINILPALLGRSSTGRQSLVEEAGSLSLVEGKWKAIRSDQKPAYDPNTRTELGNSPAPQLYDRNADPGEQRNIADAHPEIARRMLAKLDQIQSAGRSRP